MDFDVLILGSDANAYYLARCTYEAYQKKAFLIGKDRLAFTKYSNILNIEYFPDLWQEEKFVSIVNHFAKERKNKKVLVVSTNETYAEFLMKNNKKLEKNLVFAYPDLKTLKTLTNKENFYKTYKNYGLSFPETFYYNCEKSTLLPSTVSYPLILKPANVVSYNHLHFEGKNKIYKIESEEELKTTIERIKDAGYNDCLIIQEYIAGDDSYLFDAVTYVDKQGKIKVLSFAQIGLQERSKSMVGNAAVLINGFNTTKGDTEKMMMEIKKFMEKIPYHGFAEFDLKYDEKTNTFKVLEINARQGRCSYYVSALGANLIKTLVDDLIYEIPLKEQVLKEELLLSFVPKGIIKKYIKNEAFKKEALRLWKKKKMVMPMICPLDKNWKRYFMMKKRLWHYYKEYKNSYWRS